MSRFGVFLTIDLTQEFDSRIQEDLKLDIRAEDGPATRTTFALTGSYRERRAVILRSRRRLLFRTTRHAA